MAGQLKRRRTGPRATAERTYHHGDLRVAMVAATMEILQEQGLSGLSVREAAKRAGVSAGAPFRHFSSRKALLTAVAEEATHNLRRDVQAALERSGAADARTRFRALGAAYTCWALANPVQFEVISDRRIIDYDASPVLRATNDQLRALMDSLLVQILAEGGQTCLPEEIQRLRLEARALAYGLARMLIDGHFSDWAITDEAPAASIERVIDNFVARIGAKPASRG